MQSLNASSSSANGVKNTAPTAHPSSNTVGENMSLLCDDSESLKGHFGWTQLGKVHIPYIYREHVLYCSARMLETELLAPYFSHLHGDIYSLCPLIYIYHMTHVEARLFNEINKRHCNDRFGRSLFTPADCVIRLTDAWQFVNFLEFCDHKLMFGGVAASEQCGFVFFNKESVVPYGMHAGARVMPLFYFEYSSEYHVLQTELLQGWDLAYLKFCCRLQCIRSELYSGEALAVVPLTVIKSYFPHDTECTDFWPSTVDPTLIIARCPNANGALNCSHFPLYWLPQTVLPNAGGYQNSQTTSQPSTNGVLMPSQSLLHKPHGQKWAQSKSPASGHRLKTIKFARQKPAPPPLVHSAPSQYCQSSGLKIPPQQQQAQQ